MKNDRRYKVSAAIDLQQLKKERSSSHETCKLLALFREIIELTTARIASRAQQSNMRIFPLENFDIVN